MEATSARKPTPGTGSKAAQKVFDTVELLESIILHLPCEQVSRLQRVSTCWNNAVIGSAKLQIALGHRPLSLLALEETRELKKPQRPLKRAECGCITLMDTESWNIARLDRSLITVHDYHQLCIANVKWKSATLSPFLTVLLPTSVPTIRVSTMDFQIDLEALTRVVTSAPASWKNAYLTQPPTARAELNIMLRSRGFGDRMMSTFRDYPTGFSAGFLKMASSHGWPGGYYPHSAREPGVELISQRVLVNAGGVRVWDLLAVHLEIQKFCQQFDADWTVGINVHSRYTRHTYDDDEDDGDDGDGGNDRDIVPEDSEEESEDGGVSEEGDETSHGKEDGSEEYEH